MLHVGVDVWVRRAERGVTGRHGSGRQADEGDVGDDGAAGQTSRAAGERRQKTSANQRAATQTVIS